MKRISHLFIIFVFLLITCTSVNIIEASRDLPCAGVPMGTDQKNFNDTEGEVILRKFPRQGS